MDVKSVIIKAVHHKRLLALVEHTKPRPQIGAMVEHLIDKAVEDAGLDTEKPKSQRRKSA